MLPIFVISAAVIGRNALVLLALPLLYAVQLLRIGSRNRGPKRWRHAALILLAKFPEAIGAARFLATGAVRVPEYKGA